MNRLLSAIFLSVFALAWSLPHDLLAHRAPTPEETVAVTFSKESEDEIETQSLRYDSPEVSVDGDVTIDSSRDSIRFKGLYVTRQDVESDTSLAFQVFGPDGLLILRDGARTPWAKMGNDLRAHFDYTYQLSGLGLGIDDDAFTIRFNYVKEGQYWYDMRDREAALPAFTLYQLDRGERFQRLASWTPFLIPKSMPVWSAQWFKAIPSSESGEFRHRASMEAFYRAHNQRDDNRRYKINGGSNPQIRFILARMQVDENGPIDSGLGFVWDGVQWYDWGENGHFMRSYVISVPLYLALLLTSITILFLAFKYVAKIPNHRARRTATALACVATLLLCLEFLSPWLLLVALMALATALSRSCVPLSARNYVVLLLTILSQELLWSAILAASEIHLHGFFISFFLAALLFAPMILLRSRKLSKFLGIAAAGIAAIYYLSMRTYYEFFRDYPSLNTLSYASQGVKVLDSITALVEPHHLVTLFISGWCMVLIGFSSNSQEKQRETNPVAAV